MVIFTATNETLKADCSNICHAPVYMSTLFVIPQERSGNKSFTHEALSLKYKLDNEFELIFVVGHLLNYFTLKQSAIQKVFAAVILTCLLTLPLLPCVCSGGFSKDPDADICGQVYR